MAERAGPLDARALQRHQRRRLVQEGSRHRYRHAPPNTPPGFWKVGFPGDSLVREPSRGPLASMMLHHASWCMPRFSLGDILFADTNHLLSLCTPLLGCGASV